MIVILPIGEVEIPLLKHLCTQVARVFNRPCQLIEEIKVPKRALNPQRRQYLAESILEELRLGQAERLLGIVDLDLYTPGLNFIFGLANPSKGLAIIALARLRQSFYGLPDEKDLFWGRAVKEAVHELGHTYGLPHCNNRRCVMAFSNSLLDTDYKGHDFCLKCAQRLPP